MDGRIDFHAHVLPNVDHGCDGMETALIQLAQAESAGVGTVVATSHFYPDRRDAARFLDRRNAALTQLRACYSGRIRIIPAAEALVCEGLQHYDRLDELCCAGTRLLLLEMPAAPWPRRCVGTLEELAARGYSLLLAHIDRYPRREMEMLLRLPLKGQINGGALLRPIRRRWLLDAIEAGQAVALGSDVHGADGRAYRDYARANERLGEAGIRLQEEMARLLTPAETRQ